jgi:hypothetical protein
VENSAETERALIIPMYLNTQTSSIVIRVSLLTDFHDTLFKGNVFKELVKVLFEKSGYLVIPYGYENQLSSVKGELAKTNNSPTALKIRSSPDLLIYDNQTKDVKLVEVKMSSYESPRLNRNVFENYRKFWDDAILIMVLPFESVFYAQEMHNLGLKDQYDPRTDFKKVQDIFQRLNTNDLKNYGKIARNLIEAMKKNPHDEPEKQLQ